MTLLYQSNEEDGVPDMLTLKPGEDWPWMLVLDLGPEDIRKLPQLDEIGDFRLSIRRLEDGRLYADMSDEPITIPEKCAEVLQRSTAMVRFAGPSGSDSRYLYLWDAENHRRLSLRDLWPGAEAEEFLKYNIANLWEHLRKGEFPQ